MLVSQFLFCVSVQSHPIIWPRVSRGIFLYFYIYFFWVFFEFQFHFYCWLLYFCLSFFLFYSGRTVDYSLFIYDLNRIQFHPFRLNTADRINCSTWFRCSKSFFCKFPNPFFEPFIFLSLLIWLL